MISKDNRKPIVVVGDGWAALGAVGFLVREERDPIVWLAGTGARAFAPLPSLEAGLGFQGVAGWKLLSERFGIACGELQQGSFLREFRNKSFREPGWARQVEEPARLQQREESLWAPERTLAPLSEARFSALTVNDIDSKLRETLLSGAYPWIERIEGIPLASVRAEGGRVVSIALGSGREIECERLIYADRWSELSKIQGLPKVLGFTRKRDPMGMLQALFAHEKPVGAAFSEGFFSALHREPGEEQDRHVWGHFSADGSRSYWTICIGAEEAEDNHAISKRLRRMKSGLDKMFAGTPWVPEGKAEFMANVSHEQVRFEEAFHFAAGEAPRSRTLVEGIEGMSCLTDGYGPSSALDQVVRELEIPL
ncbi:MAG: hypothetical protein NDJ89_11960 [Oligoflexia bacterium]|nr:hypothetical protein [Oligoflexia bacterium]